VSAALRPVASGAQYGFFAFPGGGSSRLEESRPTQADKRMTVRPAEFKLEVASMARSV